MITQHPRAMTRGLSLLFVLLAASAAACDAARRPTLGGVWIDTLPRGVIGLSEEDRDPASAGPHWPLRETARIGSAEGEAATLLGAPVALQLDEAGRVYVLDQATRDVRVFTPDGRHLRTLGRSGSGPGELRNPIGLAWAPDGRLWVVDPGNARYTVYDTSGAFVRTVPRRSRDVVVPWPGRFDVSGRLYDVAAVHGRGFPETVLLRYDPALARADTLALPPDRAERITHAARGARHTVPLPFSPRPLWALTAAGRVWSANGSGYALALHEPGGDTLRRLVRVSWPVPVTGRDREAALAELEWFTRMGGRIDPSRFPAERPTLEAVHVDDQDGLWVRPIAAAGPGHAGLDRYDAAGRFLGRVIVPLRLGGFSSVVVRAGRLCAVHLLDDAIPQVVCFQIQAPQSGPPA